MLRVLRDASALAGSATVAKIRGIDGLTVVTDFADERVLEVIHEIRGENAEYRVLQQILSAGGLFVDVGANFGTFSLLASRFVGSAGRVIAIEPQVRLALLIEESLVLSGVTNCEVTRAACGSAPGERSLLVPSMDSGRAGFFEAFSARPGHRRERVKVSTLDVLLADQNPQGKTLIKIDVEGSEMDVLDGAMETIDRLQPAIMIELNRWSAEAAGTTPKEIIDRLASLGYSSFATAESFPQTVDARVLPLDRQTNVIATR